MNTRPHTHRAGGHFSPHLDGPWVPHEDESSVFTVVVYLNSDFQGGETRFLEEDTKSKSHFVNVWHPSKMVGKSFTVYTCAVMLNASAQRQPNLTFYICPFEANQLQQVLHCTIKRRPLWVSCIRLL